MVDVTIDKDEVYPFYSLRVRRSTEYVSPYDARFNIDAELLEEILDLQTQAGKLQTRLKELYNLHYIDPNP